MTFIQRYREYKVHKYRRKLSKYENALQLDTINNTGPSKQEFLQLQSQLNDLQAVVATITNRPLDSNSHAPSFLCRCESPAINCSSMYTDNVYTPSPHINSSLIAELSEKTVEINSNAPLHELFDNSIITVRKNY